MKRLFVMFAVSLFISFGGKAMAWDLNFPGALLQGEFKDLSKELGSAIAYRNLAPASPLGLTGFDIAIQGSFISIKNDNSYWKAAAGDSPSYIGYPSVRVRKGLPAGIDVGVMYGYVMDSNIRLYGAEISKAILEGSAASPAIGVRATYTRLAGVTDLRLQTQRSAWQSPSSPLTPEQALSGSTASQKGGWICSIWTRSGYSCRGVLQVSR
jgi:hypothetical protein